MHIYNENSGAAGIEQIPTVHLGVVTSKMEEFGIGTEQGNMSRAIAVDKGRIVLQNCGNAHIFML
jgi:hypothetical protein